jgi:hypothetical protein
MSLFHHGHHDEDVPQQRDWFDVPGPDGVVRRYPRAAFDMIVETRDPAEVQRELEHGWVLLDERSVPGGRFPSSADDLILGIEGLHVGGSPGSGQIEDVTEYTIGFLADGAQDEPTD